MRSFRAQARRPSAVNNVVTTRLRRHSRAGSGRAIQHVPGQSNELGLTGLESWPAYAHDRLLTRVEVDLNRLVKRVNVKRGIAS